MTRKLLLLALLGAATPALAGPPDEAALRDARNWDVMLNQYPPRARAAGEQGRVGFRVTLDREGYASACEVIRSSGHPRLDEETCQLIMTRGEFKGIRDANGRRVNAVVEGVLNWKLPGGASNQARPRTIAAANAPDKLICRRQQTTGSLAGFERLCLTKADWERYTAGQRDFWESQQGSKGSSHGN
jgi:protein TonB